MDSNYYGHTAKDLLGKSLPVESGRWQTLFAHESGVAERARQLGLPLGLGPEAEMAGWLHDLGKYTKRFQLRLRDPSVCGINHWAAGAFAAAQHFKNVPIAFAIDGHHTGLPSLGQLQQSVRYFQDQTRRLELTGHCPESAEVLLQRLSDDGAGLPDVAPPAKESWQTFRAALRIRMLFSCLVDADFLDTEAHFDQSRQALRAIPELSPDRAWQRLNAFLRAKSGAGQIYQLRQRLLSDCLAAASGKPGLFTLTAPTGSGKTLSSLAFALKHIIQHNSTLPQGDPERFQRIIVVIPYTSIIEQTASVFRAIFEEEMGPDYVLEHHASVAPREIKSDLEEDAEGVRLMRARLCSENWAAPIVVTTSVRFFESLFSNRPSDCRRLHSMGRSVILFDEVQTLPTQLVPSLLSSVKLLVEDYGSTAVFMTATQPAFESLSKQPNLLPYGWQPTQISTNVEGLAEAFRRTEITLPQKDEAAWSWCDLAERMTASSQALSVVNTTKDARSAFSKLPEFSRFHLSSRMCPAHRLAVLAEVRSRLLLGVSQPCHLVSTQLIEAGVDVDFPAVFRAFGPLDSIIQTAGRCNREGRAAGPQPVRIFHPAEGGSPPGAYATATAKTLDFLKRFPDAPLHLPETYRAYFEELYSLLGVTTASDNKAFALSETFDFPAAAAAFQLIDTDTHSVLVPYGEGAALIQKLQTEHHLTKEECRTAQRFSINLFPHEFKKGVEERWITQPVADWNLFVWKSHYDPALGAFHAEDTTV